MAPTKFPIHVDQSMRQQPQPVEQPVSKPPSRVPLKAALTEQQMPGGGGGGDQPAAPPLIDGQLNVKKAYPERLTNPSAELEYSFEELKFMEWKRQQEIRLMQLRRELELKRQLELAEQTNQYQENTAAMNSSMRPPQSPPNRLSIVPQSLQPTHGDSDMSMAGYGNLNEAPSSIQDWWKHTLQVPSNLDKFTVPIDQSQYIRENCPTSTPNNKDDKTKRSRKMLRPSMGGSPTMKLSPINETSRDCNSKSSSSSSTTGTTPATARKLPLLRPIRDEPDRPLNANDPTTFRKLLRALSEPLDRRSGFASLNENIVEIDNEPTRVDLVGNHYLISKELAPNSKVYAAHLLIEDSNGSGIDAPGEICIRIDKPSNDWLFYICHELHRRLVKQKVKPDIELSVMNADPAIMYLDGSILVDESFRFVTLEHYLLACAQMSKPLPKSVAVYLALELIQLAQGIHNCDIVHMNINPMNVIIMGIPNREDLANVGERTSIIKLIGFDRAMDTRLLPAEFKFQNKVDYMVVSSILESKSWCHDIDWLGVLSCIHKMFFLEELVPFRDNNDRWQVAKKFDGFPTGVWPVIFDEFLNYQHDRTTQSEHVERVVAELSSWIKANSGAVLKDFLYFDMFFDDLHKSSHTRI